MLQILISYNPEGYYYVFNRSPSNFSNSSETAKKTYWLLPHLGYMTQNFPDIWEPGE